MTGGHDERLPSRVPRILSVLIRKPEYTRARLAASRFVMNCVYLAAFSYPILVIRKPDYKAINFMNISE